MPLELEHAIGCNVEFKGVCHYRPNSKDYVSAVGGVVIVADMEDPHEQQFLKGHDEFITCLAVSHSGDLCATGQQGSNADVVLWDLNSKSLAFRFQEHDHGIDAVCFSHDDRFLISCGNAVDGRFFVWDCSGGLIIAWGNINPKPTLSIVPGGFVRDIKRRETHEYQFAACGGKTVTMWHLNAATGDLVAHPVGSAGKQTREFQCLVFSSDYEHLFAGTTTGDITVILMKNRVMQAYIPACSAGVTSLCDLPFQNGAAILAGGGDGTITYLCGPTPYDIRDENQVRLDGGITSMSLRSDAAEVLVVSSLGTTFRIKPRDLTFMCHNQVSAGGLYDIEYLQDRNDLFLTASGDGMVTLWDANDYKARLKCPVRSRSYPTTVTGSEDIIVAGLSDGKMMSFDAVQGQSLWSIDDAHKGGVTCLRLPSNVRFVLSGGAEGELRVWELKTRQMISNLKEHVARVNDLQMFPNDQFAVSCSRDRCLLTWDLRAEKRLTSHREKHGGINCLAVASNQTTVITAGQEKALTYWDLRMADPIRSVELDEEISSLSISYDDRYLVTGGSSHVVKVWDVQAASVISTGTGHSRAIQRVSWSPDGKQAVSVGLDTSILVWNFYGDHV